MAFHVRLMLVTARDKPSIRLDRAVAVAVAVVIIRSPARARKAQDGGFDFVVFCGRFLELRVDLKVDASSGFHACQLVFSFHRF